MPEKVSSVKEEAVTVKEEATYQQGSVPIIQLIVPPGSESLPSKEVVVEKVKETTTTSSPSVASKNDIPEPLNAQQAQAAQAVPTIHLVLPQAAAPQLQPILIQQPAPPAQVVRTETTYEVVEGPNLEAQALHDAMDMFSRRYPGQTANVEMIQAWAKQLLAGRRQAIPAKK